MGIAESDLSSSLPPSGEDEKEDATSKDLQELSASHGTHKEEPEDSSTSVAKKSFKFKLSIFMICLTSVVVAMDAVIVAATLPAITVSLKGSSLKAFWVGTSYLLAQTVSSPYEQVDCIYDYLYSYMQLTNCRWLYQFMGQSQIFCVLLLPLSASTPANLKSVAGNGS
jgi:hypothetical protein